MEHRVIITFGTPCNGEVPDAADRWVVADIVDHAAEIVRARGGVPGRSAHYFRPSDPEMKLWAEPAQDGRDLRVHDVERPA